jgi:hypothetical protein
MENEIWKLTYCSPFYEVSNLGRIRSVDRLRINFKGKQKIFKGQILNPVIDRSYLKINLVIKKGKRMTKLLHQLIYHSFNSTTPKQGMVVDHIDGNPGNNHLSNLQFITYSANTIKGKLHLKKTSGLPLYISNERNGFVIKKTIGGKKVWFGRFKTIEKAIKRRDELIYCNWQV